MSPPPTVKNPQPRSPRGSRHSRMATSAASWMTSRIRRGELRGKHLADNHASLHGALRDLVVGGILVIQHGERVGITGVEVARIGPAIGLRGSALTSSDCGGPPGRYALVWAGSLRPAAFVKERRDRGRASGCWWANGDVRWLLGWAACTRWGARPGQPRRSRLGPVQLADSTGASPFYA